MIKGGAQNFTLLHLKCETFWESEYFWENLKIHMGGDDKLEIDVHLSVKVWNY